MTAYQIKIYKNDYDSTLMYDSGSIAVSPAFEPHDKYGNATYFTAIISAAALSTAGIVNGYQYGYKMLITQWWGVSDYVEQTSASVFITRSTPTISINAIANPVTSSSLTITAAYSQAQGDPISTVEWVFALAGSESTPIRRTGAISTQVLSFDADGLITGNTYSIMCNVVTSTGMEASTGFVQFPVLYSSSSLGINYELAQLKNSSAVYLSWDNMGSNILSYPYTDTTKTTNGVTFTVNGEGDVKANGTAYADAYFTMASGTLSQIGITAGQRLIITSGYSGAKIEVTETNNSNIVVSTITGNDPLQYIVPATTNTLKFSIVIPSGVTVSSQMLQPMFDVENRIVGVNDLSVTMQPTQDLHGYSSPWPGGGGVNIIPAIDQTGNGFMDAYRILSDNTIIHDYSYYISQYFPITPGKTYTYTVVNYGSETTSCAAFYDSEYNFISAITGKPNGNEAVAPPNAAYMRASNTKSGSELYYTLNEGPYSNICPITGLTGLSVYVSPTSDVADATAYSVDWTSQAGTVYHGTLDVVTGVLTVDYANIASYNGETIGEPWLSSMDEYSPGATPTTGAQVVYTLATPVTYQLTAQQITALVGTNNVWSNANSVSVTYTKENGSQATLSGPIVTFSDSNAALIPTPQYIPGITGISIYRYLQGESALQHVYDLATGATAILDYFAPSQTKVSYLIVAHSGIGDLFLQTAEFMPTFWFYSILLCDTDSNGDYHVSKEYIFKYGVETGTVSNNNEPTIQKNFTPYPNRQPISTLYKTGKISGYIGKTNSLNRYSDSVSLQNAIYDISVSSLDKYIKSRKGDVIKVDTASSIQMKTEDDTVQQALKATVDWVEVGDSSHVSIVSVPTDSFWPLT